MQLICCPRNSRQVRRGERIRGFHAHAAQGVGAPVRALALGIGLRSHPPRHVVGEEPDPVVGIAGRCPARQRIVICALLMQLICCHRNFVNPGLSDGKSSIDDFTFFQQMIYRILYYRLFDLKKADRYAIFLVRLEIHYVIQP
jgi:hypothetical protein